MILYVMLKKKIEGHFKELKNITVILCRLPLMTLVAHRACNSTAGMIGPLVWNRPMMPSVGRSRDGGKILL